MSIVLSGPMATLSTQASALGLEVEIKDNGSDHVMQSVTLIIRRPQVAEPTNMLEVVNNAEAVHVHAVRMWGKGRWNHHVTFWGYGQRKGTWMPLKHVRYRMEGWAKDAAN